MYTIDDKIYGKEKLILVIAVRPLDDYKLWLRFSDGAVKIFDFKPELWRVGYQPLKDKKIFDTVYVDYGAPVWCNGEIDIAPETVYDEGVAVEAEIATPALVAV